MTKIKNFINLIKTHYIISGIVLAILIFVGFKIFANNKGNQEIFTAEMGNVTQKVMVTGKTKAVHSVNLGFENNGKVSGLYVDVGSRVGIGQILVSLDKAEKTANLLSAEARLEDLKNGTRPEELVVAETGVSNAKTTLADAQSNMSDKILDAYTKSDDAIHNTVDQFFSNPTSANPQFNLVTTNTQLKNDINQGRFQIETLLNNWKNSLNAPTTSPVPSPSDSLSQIKAFVDNVAIAVNSQTSSGSISQATIDAYKASVSVARTNITTAINNLSSATEKLNSAQSALTLAENNLALKKVGNTAEAIKAQEAVVMQYQAQLANMTLYSPLNGVVTKKDVEVGEIITPGKSVISIISDSDLEIESNVSEINIGKLNIGNKVNITLDAFPGQIFNGTVTYIEPAETIVDGVVNYKITVAFSQKYPQIKSGLTANLEIITSEKNNVVRIPVYALIKKDSGTFVSKQVGKKFVEVPIVTGLVGQDGFVEVVSGLRVGDAVNTATPAK